MKNWRWLACSCAAIIGAFALPASTATTAWAEGIDQQGMASLPSDSGPRGQVDPALHAELLRAAEVDAIKRYAATFSPAKFKLYQQAEADILSRPDDYMAQPVVLDEGYRKDSRQYFIVIRATIDANRFEAAFVGAAGSASAAVGRKVSLTFLFVARTAASVREFQDRTTNVDITQQDVNAHGGGHLAGGGAKYSESKTETDTETTGGSTLRQANQTTWAVDSPEDMNATMSQVFSDAGFDVAAYEDVSANCGGLKPADAYQAFKTLDQLPPEMRRDAFGAARRCNLNTFATGTMDVGLPSDDPVSGNKRVFVSVRAQVTDVSGPLPKLLASVGPVQYAGLGPDPDVARRNALINAAAEAAKEIRDQLKSKGLN
jgi:hypothetical protein